jgi:SAM-dependent methyltransferase
MSESEERRPAVIGTISAQDIEHLRLIRDNIRQFMRRIGAAHGQAPAKLLDIAPQDHEGARPYFPARVTVETLDINPDAGATYVGDICRHNDCLADATFDFIVCTEVLEHTLQPFGAVDELRRILRPGGLMFVTVPFNFRIHGPLPDCWRFTEHGLRALFKDWDILELQALEAHDRFLMPIHYTLVVQKAGA